MDNNTESNNNEQAKEPTTIEIIEKVKETEEFKTLLKNSNEAYWKSNIGGELKNIYSTIDTAISTHLGVEKPENVKTSEWVETHIKQLADTKKELETLKNAKGQANEAQEKLWTDKVNKLKGELQQVQQALEAEKVNGFKSNINNQIDSFLADKKFKATYSEFDLRDLLEAKKRRIRENTKKLDNGKIAVINPATGEYYLDALGEPLTVAQVAEKEFTTMFEASKTGGNTPTEQNSASVEGDVLAIDMNKVKTKGDFYSLFGKLMAPKGLASHSDEYLKIQRATIAHYKINNLPM